MDSIAILGLLAHRYPFLLVDRIVELESGRLAVGIKQVTGGEWFCAGQPAAGMHMPNLLVVEALAQTSGAVMVGLVQGEAGGAGVSGYFAALDRVRLRDPARPGDELRLAVVLRRFRRGICRLSGRATVDGRLVVSAELTTVVRTNRPL